MNFYDLLANDADDSLLEIIEYNSKILILSFIADALGGEKHFIKIYNPIHLDMPPKVMLGYLIFGDKKLLPPEYEENRNKGYDGDEANWRILKVIDDEENEYYAIYITQETIE